MSPDASAADPYERRRLALLDTEMAYVDAGTGSVLVRFVNEHPDGGFGFQFSVAITGTVR